MEPQMILVVVITVANHLLFYSNSYTNFVRTIFIYRISVINTSVIKMKSLSILIIMEELYKGGSTVVIKNRCIPPETVGKFWIIIDSMTDFSYFRTSFPIPP